MSHKRGHAAAPPTSISPEVKQRVAAHIGDLMEVPCMNPGVIAMAAGISKTTAMMAVKGERLSPRTAGAILAVTPADAAECREWVPAEPVARKMRDMQSLGYPLAWQCRQAGCRGARTAGEGKRIRRSTAEAIDKLSERIGNQPADPERVGMAAVRKIASRGACSPAAERKARRRLAGLAVVLRDAKTVVEGERRGECNIRRPLAKLGIWVRRAHVTGELKVWEDIPGALDVIRAVVAQIPVHPAVDRTPYWTVHDVDPDWPAHAVWAAMVSEIAQLPAQSSDRAA